MPSISEKWISAEILFRPGCNYYGQIRALPLVPRPFPLLEEKPAEFMLQMKPHSGVSFEFDPNGVAVIPANTHAACVLDLGVHTTAFISTSWNGADATIKFTYSEALWLQDSEGKYYKKIGQIKMV